MTGTGVGRRALLVGAVVGVTVAVVQAGVVALVLYRGAVLRDFANLGRKFATQSTASPFIGPRDPGYVAHPAHEEVGFDGQFAYYMAVDPVNGVRYTDYPFVRYQRFIYPALARILALGTPALVPATLVIVNILAAALGAGVIATYLSQRGMAPALALLYGVGPGAVSVVLKDLSECVEWSLIATGLVLYLLSGRRRLLVPGVFFGMSVLTKDNGLAVILPIVAWDVLAGSWDQALTDELRVRLVRAAGWLSLIGLPYLAWSGLMKLWIHLPEAPGYLGARVPSAGGVLAIAHRGDLLNALMFTVPALMTLGLGVWAFARGRRDLETALMVLAPLVYSLLVGAAWSGSSVDLARLSIGITVIALISWSSVLPVLPRLAQTAYWVVLTIPTVLFLTYAAAFIP